MKGPTLSLSHIERKAKERVGALLPTPCMPLLQEPSTLSVMLPPAQYFIGNAAPALCLIGIAAHLFEET